MRHGLARRVTTRWSSTATIGERERERDREREHRSGSCKDDNGNSDKIKQHGYKEPWRTEIVSTTKRFSLHLQRRHRIVSTVEVNAESILCSRKRAGREEGVY